MREWLVIWSACLALAGAACDDRTTEAEPAADHPPSEAAPAAAGEPSHSDEAEAVYECPMHCKVEGEDQPYRQAEPGQCPVCGMDLKKQD